MPIQSPPERTHEAEASAANAPKLETDPSYGPLICNVASNGSGTVAKMDSDSSYGSLICKVADQIADWLVQGNPISSHKIAIAMRPHFGSGAEGCWTIKDSHEAQEVALIKAIQRQLVGSAGHLAQHLTTNPQTIRAWLQGLQKSLPTHTGRTDESNDLQQFSTPLELGYLAYLAGNPQPWDILLEPSAGTGMLAVLASVVVDSMILNEISDRRADILRQVYGQTVATFNAEQIHNYLPADRLPTLTFLNPPFSSSPNISRRAANATLKHLRSALKRTSTNGRIVLISAHWFHPDQPEWQDAFAQIQKEATLMLSVPVPGAVYQRHGTHMQTRLSVFEKRPAPQADIFSGVVHEEDLESLFLRVIALPPRQPADIAILDGQHLQDSEAETVAIATDQIEADQKPSSPPLVLVEAKTTFEDVIEIQYRPRQVGAAHPGELSEGVYETYLPQRIEIVGSQTHPSKLCESAAMASVIPPMPSYRPMLPRQIVENGILSEAQLEAIVYAGEAHSRYLKGTYKVADDLSQITPTAPSSSVATQFRRGWFLGDGTGCGKGRQIAGMIADGWVRGRKKALWISEKATLIEDARRDWAALGGDRLDITSLSKFKLGVPIPIGSGILFCTYATLRSQAQQGKKSRLQQVIDWLGPDFDGLICFDESHALAGALKTKTERGQAAGSLQGKAGICLQNGIPHARIVYVSATGATKVESLAYASRLGLWQTGDFPFANREEFINQISNSGIAAMEVVARDLKSLGLYMARTLSYEGVEYSPLVVSLTPEQRQIYDKFANIFQIIHQN